MKRPVILSGLIAATILISPKPLLATTFTVSGNDSSAKTLSSGETGTVTSIGTLSTSGGTVAITVGGGANPITISNSGIIRQTGSGRAIDATTTNATINVTNSGTISSVSTDAFRVNVDATVSLTNSGTISVSAGGQAIDWAAITTKSNTLTNLAGGVISAVGEDAVRPGTNGVVNNAGTIMATTTGGASPTGSDGIDLRTFTGISVTNTGSISGRHGIATDGSNVGPSTLTVNNNAGTIFAINGSGINVDGPNASVTANVTNAFGATIKGGVLAAATDGDGDGVDVDGVLTLDNAGDIFGLGARGAGNNPEGVAAGGGSITNRATGRIIGSASAADAPNGEVGHVGNGILMDNSSGSNAVAATTITNSGLIQGKGGSAIKIVGTFADTVTNNAGGTIQGGNTTAAIQTGGGNDQVINRGAIVGDGGKAIDMEGGNNTLTIEGGAASIVGDVSGGTGGTNTLNLDPGAGNLFAYAGSFSNFNTVEVKSGTVRLTGVSTYTGTTKVTGRLELVGANRLAATNPLDLNGGYLKITASGPNGQTFAKLTLEDNSIIDLDNSTSLTFNGLDAITPGKTLGIVNWDAQDSPDYAIRFAGDLTSNLSFLDLINATTVNGSAASYLFDGTYTEVFTAVPEPSTFGFALALGGFIAFRRSRALRTVTA